MRRRIRNSTATAVTQLWMLLLWMLGGRYFVFPASAALGIVSMERGLDGTWDFDDDDDTANSCNFVGVIRLGGPFSLDQENRFFNLGTRQLTAYHLVLDYMNRHQCGVTLTSTSNSGVAVKESYALQLVTYDDQSSVAQSTQIAQHIAPQVHNSTNAFSTTNFNALVGGYSSTLTEPLAAAAEQYQRLLLAPGAASTFVFENRPHVFGTVPPVSQYLNQAVQGLAQQAGAQSIATVYEDASFTRGVCGSAPDLAQEYNLQFTSATQVPETPSVEALLPIVQRLRDEEQPDVVITCVYDQGCLHWMQALQQMEWSPQAQVFTVCVGLEDFTQTQAARGGVSYIMGVTP